MPDVIVYGTAICPYCIRARSMLDKKGVSYEDVRLDQHPERRQEMEARANGRTSVPQIFIDDRHIGGFDDMAELDIDDELDPLLGLSGN